MELPRRITRAERPRLIAWLDHGLRRGIRGRLEAEYPLSLRPDRLEVHRAIYCGERPVAHAAFHEVRALGPAGEIPVGMIGLVYTEPALRGRGLASACVRACVSALRERGLPLALLWSDRKAFYHRLGFEPAGRERLLGVDSELCRRALQELDPGRAPLGVEPVRPGDFEVLEALYAVKPLRARRAPGELALLAAAPQTQMVVARRGGRARAYAVLGRGDDFAGVVHEWAGSPSGVLSCLAALARGARGLAWLTGPAADPAVEALRTAGAREQHSPFALARILDAPALWQRVREKAPALDAIHLEEGPEGFRLECPQATWALSHRQALDLLLGETLPGLLDGLVEAERRALAACLPLPLYLWGFDSI